MRLLTKLQEFYSYFVPHSKKQINIQQYNHCHQCMQFKAPLFTYRLCRRRKYYIFGITQNGGQIPDIEKYLFKNIWFFVLQSLQKQKDRRQKQSGGMEPLVFSPLTTHPKTEEIHSP